MEGRVDIATNGIRLSCVVTGSGPLLLLLHGFPETAYAWRKQIDALSQRFRVVAPDLRGYGESARPTAVDAYRGAVLAADIAGLITALGAERAHVAGHDWGGGVAWILALDRPEVVDRLVVLNCPHPAVMARALRSSWSQIRRSWYIFAFQIPWLPERLLLRNGARPIRDALRRSALRPETFTDADLDVYARAFAQPGAATGAINYYRAAFRDRTRRRRARIAAPTLLIWGDADFALGVELTRGMEPLFSGELRIEHLPGASHWVMEEWPDEVNRLMLDFLTR